jgi:PTS system N-acetylglucosamine-specific IIC component
MTGFFPVMMFGLPAACLAMYRCAQPGRRKAVAGLLASMALTSFLTGITEPIEFTFMFLAPMLFLIHALLTGLSMALMDLLGVRHGFGFSAGLFDFLLNLRLASRGWLILPIGIAYFAVYYAVFRWFILRFDVPTPGRGGAEATPAGAGAPAEADAEAAAILAALGGAGNLLDIDACTTRLRLRVSDPVRVDEAALKSLGAAGVLRAGKDTVQVVVGLRADDIAGRLRRLVLQAVPAVHPDTVATALAALGGRDNLEEVESFGNRLTVRVREASRVRSDNLPRHGLRALAQVARRQFHLLADEDTAGLADRLREQA